MNVMRTQAGLGCLYIDDLASGERDFPGPSVFIEAGRLARPLDGAGDAGLWERLQCALQAARSRCDVCGIVARGTGCAAALALAEQLPVDRLVLCAPRLSIRRDVWSKPDPKLRQMRRIAAYARRNLSLCVADTLIVGETPAEIRAAGWWNRCRVGRVELPGSEGEKLYTIREIASKRAISRFLHTGELPKTLAQNPEMCIIDG